MKEKRFIVHCHELEGDSFWDLFATELSLAVQEAEADLIRQGRLPFEKNDYVDVLEISNSYRIDHVRLDAEQKAKREVAEKAQRERILLEQAPARRQLYEQLKREFEPPTTGHDEER